ncbi:Histone-lysine N-methyltransferase PRDM9 [Chionoecetes opilio]|uniref:Histone-lysine N-methyltransferase PRDM9 n=1 Tax=Chionoecetes opilio TaxID=41210 RepID=A0A8J4YKS5_CHIOP|nr:Histone-lysine N-methyltransferase PRDM9 [Chionoecetes opilio]
MSSPATGREEGVRRYFTPEAWDKLPPIDQKRYYNLYASHLVQSNLGALPVSPRPAQLSPAPPRGPKKRPRKRDEEEDEDEDDDEWTPELEATPSLRPRCGRGSKASRFAPPAKASRVTLCRTWCRARKPVRNKLSAGAPAESHGAWRGGDAAVPARVRQPKLANNGCPTADAEAAITAAPATAQSLPSTAFTLTASLPVDADSPKSAINGCPTADSPKPAINGCPQLTAKVCHQRLPTAEAQSLPSMDCPTADSPKPAINGCPTADSPKPAINGCPTADSPKPANNGCPTADSPKPANNGCPTADSSKPAINGCPTADSPKPAINGCPTADSPKPAINGCPTADSPKPAINGCPTADSPKPAINGCPTADSPKPAINGCPTADSPKPAINGCPTADSPKPAINGCPTADSPKPAINDCPTADSPKPAINDCHQDDGIDDCPTSIFTCLPSPGCSEDKVLREEESAILDNYLSGMADGHSDPLCCYAAGLMEDLTPWPEGQILGDLGEDMSLAAEAQSPPGSDAWLSEMVQAVRQTDLLQQRQEQEKQMDKGDGGGEAEEGRAAAGEDKENADPCLAAGEPWVTCGGQGPGVLQPLPGPAKYREAEEGQAAAGEDKENADPCLAAVESRVTCGGQGPGVLQPLPGPANTGARQPRYRIRATDQVSSRQAQGAAAPASPREGGRQLDCDECAKEWLGECSLHTLTLVLDTPVARDGSEGQRARLTAPWPLRVAPSQVEGAGLGVWTDADLPPRLVFGPYEGRFLSRVEEGTESGYGWRLRAQSDPLCCVDAADPTISNWMRYVNCARSDAEINLRAFQYKGHIYYKTRRTITRGSELMVWYGDEYGAELGLSRTQAPAEACKPVGDASRGGRRPPSPAAPPTPRLPAHPPVRPPPAPATPPTRSLKAAVRDTEVRGQVGKAAGNPSSAPAPQNDPPAVTAAAGAASGGRSVGGGEGDGNVKSEKMERREDAEIEKEKPFPCPECGTRFTSRATMQTHRRVHSGEKPCVCPECGEGFTWATTLQAHRVMHTGEMPYKCPECAGLRRRRRTMAMAEGSAETHKCVFCDHRFPSKAELQTHFRLHANGDIDIKGRPRVRHKVPEEEQCGGSDSCGAEEGSLGAPVQTDASPCPATPGRQNAVCDVCGEVFRTVSQAISHKFRKHPDSLLKHYCPHCGMMFPIKVNRDRHLLSHAAAAPTHVFPCRPCGVTFYNHTAKKFHMESAHKGAIRMVNPVRTPAPSMKIVVNNAGEAHSIYYCHLCGCEYQVKYNLQKHLAAKHSQAERDGRPKELVQCNLCSAVFYTKRAYQAHSHHHRDGDLFATNEQ